MEKLGHNTEMAAKVTFSALRNTFAALLYGQQRPFHMELYECTHAINTDLGSAVFGSLTLRKANWIRPSLKSSIKSTSSPSGLESALFSRTMVRMTCLR